MKALVMSVLLGVLLCGCTANNSDTSCLLQDHTHSVSAVEHTVEHEIQGYCGNTITSVRYHPMGKKSEWWERSIWGGHSVSLTDFLRWFDYCEDVCRCLPEFYVKTEFAPSEYGINLSEGYVRYEQGQVSLTAEQVEYLTGLLDEISADKGMDILLPENSG